MATVRHDFHLDADPARVWHALRDFGGAERLFPGVVSEARLDGDVRTVRFADGGFVRERLVTRDDDARRLVYGSVDSPIAIHHSAALAVREDPSGGTIVSWTTDVLPDALAGPIHSRVREGADALRRVLEGG